MPSRSEGAMAAARTTLCNLKRNPLWFFPGSGACNYARSSSQTEGLPKLIPESSAENTIPIICQTCPALIEALIIHGFTMPELLQSFSK